MNVDVLTEDASQPERYQQFRSMVPLLLFLVMVVILGIGLTMNPNLVPSALIGKPIPQFQLPPVKGRELGLSSADLVGDVSMVNIFASWCTSCLVEHPIFMRMAANGTVPIYGINYKDDPDDAAGWLAKYGDPYTRIGADQDGRVGIDWGVYGVPETFVIDRQGMITYKHIGPVTEKDLDEIILPLIRKLRDPQR